MRPIIAHRYKKKSCIFDVRVGDRVVFQTFPSPFVYHYTSPTSEVEAEVLNCTEETFIVRPLHQRKWRKVRKNQFLYMNSSKRFRFFVQHVGINHFELRIDDPRAEAYRIRMRSQDRKELLEGLNRVPSEIEQLIQQLGSRYKPGDMITFRGAAGQVIQWKVKEYHDINEEKRPGIYGYMILDEDPVKMKQELPLVTTWTNRNEKIGFVPKKIFGWSKNMEQYIFVFIDEKVLTGLFDDDLTIGEYVKTGNYLDHHHTYPVPLMKEGKIIMGRTLMQKLRLPNGDFIIKDITTTFVQPNFNPDTQLNFPNSETLPPNFYWYGPYIVHGLGRNPNGTWKYYLPHENIGFIQRPIVIPTSVLENLATILRRNEE